MRAAICRCPLVSEDRRYSEVSGIRGKEKVLVFFFFGTLCGFTLFIDGRCALLCVIRGPVGPTEAHSGRARTAAVSLHFFHLAPAGTSVAPPHHVRGPSMYLYWRPDPALLRRGHRGPARSAWVTPALSARPEAASLSAPIHSGAGFWPPLLREQRGDTAPAPPVPRPSPGLALVFSPDPRARPRSPRTRPKRAGALRRSRPHAVRQVQGCVVFSSDSFWGRVSAPSTARAASGHCALSALCLRLGPFSALVPCLQTELRIAGSRDHSGDSCNLGCV
ncbi:hypothetical protein NDU88_005426 [Pleurodeles waltl]|uniref:Uncharacterized protein n=1 Tax=Pleurodeles waltl TaxID=8319 RepID=A0AAV7VIY9_PLEWA|nr:hypothetical protein NDU88_005426 [Pleurodeles waltl]